MSDTYIEDERHKRLESYETPDLHHETLRALNEQLESIDSRLTPLLPGGDAPPSIMVLGLPRSWTTLCVQLLTTGLDVGSVTNIAARFWNAPVAGMVLSQMLDKGKRDRSFDSDYGKTDDPFGPHEFSYFWHKWFKMKDFPYDPAAVAADIDWAGFSTVLGDMAKVGGKPLVLKGMDVVYHLPKVHQAVENSLFIWVERDLEQVALSMAKARMDYYGDINEWCSVFPLNAKELMNEPWYEQVAGQIYGLWQLHMEQVEKVDSRRIIRFAYEDVCANPKSLLDCVTDRMDEVFSYKVDRGFDLPAHLSPQNTVLDSSYEAPLLEALRKRMTK